MREAAFIATAKVAATSGHVDSCMTEVSSPCDKFGPWSGAQARFDCHRPKLRPKHRANSKLRSRLVEAWSMRFACRDSPIALSNGDDVSVLLTSEGDTQRLLNGE